MLRLRPAFADCKVTYATVNPKSAADVKGHNFHAIPDGNRDTKFSLIRMALKVLWVVLKTRPNIVISTGAAPGYFACRFARLIGAKSLFIDSIANAEELSLSAQLATSHASRVYSQWPKVADKNNLPYHGSIL